MFRNSDELTTILNLGHEPGRTDLVIVRDGAVVATFQPQTRDEWRQTIFALGLAGMLDCQWTLLGTSRIMFDLIVGRR